MNSIRHRVEIIKEKFSHSLGLPFQEVLPEALIEEAIAAEKITYRKRLFTPVVTVWAFLSQILDADQTCANVVSRVLAWLASSGQPLPSPDPSAYCQARKRLAEGLLGRLFRRTAQRLQEQVGVGEHWHGRQVFFIDGSTLLLPDTPANQAVYPQHKNQAAGCGFPLMRIVALFSGATGAVCDLLSSAWKTAEIQLSRQLYGTLPAGVLLVGDRLLATYADLAWLKQQRVEGLFRSNGRRKVDFRRGFRLGKADHLVVWTKPVQRPQGVSKEEFERLPPVLVVRELRYTITRKGWRSKQVTLVTTLLDAKAYPKVDLAQLYGLRWQAESCQPENGASRTFTKQGCGRNYLCGSLFINRFFALSCATVSPVTHNRFSIHAICYRRYPMPDCPVPPRPGRVSSPPGCHGSGSNCLLVMRKAC